MTVGLRRVSRMSPVGAVVNDVTLRVRQLALHEAIALLPYTTGAAAVASIGLVSVKIWRQPTFAHFTTVLIWAMSALVVAVVLGVSFGRRPIALPRWLNGGGLTSWVLGIQAGILLLVVPVLVLTKSVAEDDIPGWNVAFLNKRWLIALYNVTVLALLVFPALVERWRSPSAAFGAANARPHPVRRWPRTIGGLVVVAVLAWYFAGPPWHLERHHRSIDWHEQIHLGSLQAIAKGYLPYIGPASTVYGPGSQILVYGAMRRLGTLDIVSFRTAWATLNFAALLAVGAAASLWLGVGPAVLVIALALTYSPFASFFTFSDGTFAGFYGWANAFRYIAPLIVVPEIARAAADGAPSRSTASRVVVLGGIWAVAAWIAQENLSTTVVASGLLLTLLWATGTTSVSSVLRVARHLTIGFACVAAPLLLYYALQGVLGAFLSNYFRVPHAVAMGYSNLWWPPQDSARPDRYSYFFTLPFLIVLATCVLWKVPALRLEAPLDVRRTRLLAFICVLATCYQTALFRSDYSHMMNAMLALPFVLVLGFVDLPHMLSTTWRQRLAIRAVFIVTVCAIYPALPLQHWGTLLAAPMTRFRSAPSLPVAGEDESRVAFRRATSMLADEPLLAGGAGLSMRTFLDFATDIHDLVGSRKTVITGLGGRAFTGLLYFMADLTPAPYPLDRESMTINDSLRSQAVDHIRTHPDDYECFIGISLAEPEARAFLETHPGAVHAERVIPAGESWPPQTVHILLSPSPAAALHRP